MSANIRADPYVNTHTHTNTHLHTCMPTQVSTHTCMLLHSHTSPSPRLTASLGNKSHSTTGACGQSELRTSPSLVFVSNSDLRDPLPVRLCVSPQVQGTAGSRGEATFQGHPVHSLRLDFIIGDAGGQGSEAPGQLHREWAFHLSCLAGLKGGPQSANPGSLCAHWVHTPPQFWVL